jgi:hypothetical protein
MPIEGLCDAAIQQVINNKFCLQNNGKYFPYLKKTIKNNIFSLETRFVYL